MSTANTQTIPQDATTASDVEDTGTFHVLVSYYDAEDFEGDWRWGADCPAVGVATDGRTREEALKMVKDAIQGMLSDYPRASIRCALTTKPWPRLAQNTKPKAGENTRWTG